MYEMKAKLNSRTLQLINSVDSVAKAQMGLLSTAPDIDQADPEATCLQELNNAISTYGYYTVAVICQIIKLSEVYVLKSRFDDFEKAFKEAERVYMCMPNEPESGAILDLLISLSWKLCTLRRGLDAHCVNNLVTHIKHLAQETAKEI